MPDSTRTRPHEGGEAELRQENETFRCFYSREDEAYVAVFTDYPTLSGIAETPEQATRECLIAYSLALASTYDELSRVERERNAAQADAAALREAADRFHYAVAMNTNFDGRFDPLTVERSKALMVLIKAKHPGAALLAVIEAARLAAALIDQWENAGFHTTPEGQAFRAALAKFD